MEHLVPARTLIPAPLKDHCTEYSRQHLLQSTRKVLGRNFCRLAMVYICNEILGLSTRAIKQNGHIDC